MHGKFAQSDFIFRNLCKFALGDSSGNNVSFLVIFLHELILVVEIDDFLVGFIVNNDFSVVSVGILEGFVVSEEK